MANSQSLMLQHFHLNREVRRVIGQLTTPTLPPWWKRPGQKLQYPTVVLPDADSSAHPWQMKQRGKASG